ncbi:MAG: sigma-70 family RNA polymerase sigma factor [Candidatus Marinimicrobia bacterium]|nr:sigma-70 family RNA polymerase sigma factor [Candidatus Neomarinimicrobiota bacterium]
MTDEILIERFLSGDVSAFNTLVWRWEKQIYNFILRYLGDYELAKDVMQRTFIRAYKGLSKLKDKKRFSTWLFQIALNQCKDEFKKRKRRHVSINEVHRDENSCTKELISIIADPKDGPENATQMDSVTSVLKRALQCIPEEQRVVIIMKEYHGLKFIEIAEILRVPLNTIKSRMYYGLNSLRKVLQQWGVDREDLGYEV